MASGNDNNRHAAQSARMLLVLVAAGGPVVAASSGNHAADALLPVAPGFMVIAIIYFMGTVSGAHLNPAVTIAFAIRRNFPRIRVSGYIIAQVAGGWLAALFLGFMFGNGAFAAGMTLPGRFRERSSVSSSSGSSKGRRQPPEPSPPRERSTSTMKRSSRSAIRFFRTTNQGTMAHEFDGKKYEQASAHQKEWGEKLTLFLMMPGGILLQAREAKMG